MTRPPIEPIREWVDDHKDAFMPPNIQDGETYPEAEERCLDDVAESIADAIEEHSNRPSKTDVYAVYEATTSGQMLRGLFPGTSEGCEAAIEWGESKFDDFHAAKIPRPSFGSVYLKKEHGVTIGSVSDE